MIALSRYVERKSFSPDSDSIIKHNYFWDNILFYGSA